MEFRVAPPTSCAHASCGACHGWIVLSGCSDVNLIALSACFCETPNPSGTDTWCAHDADYPRKIRRMLEAHDPSVSYFDDPRLERV